MKRCGVGLLVAGIIAINSAPAQAQNLVTNPTFDTDHAGWTGSATWVADDCCGNTASGSIFTTQFSALISNCIDVTGGSSYDLSLWSKFVPVLDPLDDNGYAHLVWMSSAACGGVPIDFPNFPGLAPGAAQTWHQVGATFAAPAGAQSVSIELGSSNCGLSCGGTTYFDNVAFGPTGTVPVELQTFFVD